MRSNWEDFWASLGTIEDFFFFGYASVATPLSDLLKKEAFIWSLKAKS